MTSASTGSGHPPGRLRRSPPRAANSCAPSASPSSKEDHMGHVVIATWKAKPGARDKVLRILEEMTPGNRSEPKMVHFQAQVSTTEPDTIVLYEHYTDESGYED